MDQNKGKGIDLSLKLGPSNHEDQEDNQGHNVNGIRVCRACGTNSTCMWRRGPDGPQTLCNACGLKFMRAQKRGRE